jgi:putative ABC transport system substrate-binding protein
MNHRRRLVMVLGACALATPLASLAQQKSPNVPRIGFLEAGPPSSIAARVEASEQGLHELGYVEGKNIVIEYRYANGVFDRLPALAAELVRLKVDVIVTGGPTSIRPASEATKTIPIVMAFDTDPVASEMGRKHSLAQLRAYLRPG